MTAPAIETTLLIPTYNRSDMLRDALLSIARSVVSRPQSIEVIVVDNNSRDDTRAVVEALIPGFPFRLIYVNEARQGVSHARNTGIARSSGEYVAIMDHDMQIHPDYLELLPASFRRHHADCLGGWVAYHGIEAFPEWLRAMVSSMGQRDYGPDPVQLTDDRRRLAGGNMAFARPAFAKFGIFRSDLGVSGNKAKYGEDLEIQDRLVRMGGRLFYDPALRQDHYLEPERFVRRYYLMRSFHSGRGAYRMAMEGWSGARKMLGIPFGLFVRLGQSIGGVLALPPLPPGERFRRLCAVIGRLGEIAEAFAIWRAGGRVADV